MSETLTVRLDDEMAIALAREAARTHRPKGQIVREALHKHLRRKQRSALEVLQEHVGSITGPEDLSVNKAHLATFGKGRR